MKSRPCSNRRSFTIIELLIVITIIAILATISLQVVGGLIGQARDSATKATISKIQGLLNSRAQAFDRMTVMKPDGSGTVRKYLENSMERVAINVSYGNVAPQTSTQLMLARKMFQAKYFPQYAAEMVDAPAGSALSRGMYGLYPNDVETPAGSGNWVQKTPPGLINHDGTVNPNASPTEILYQFLTQANALGTTPVGLDTFSAAEVRDSDNDGLPEFVDAWGNALRFYRWPTRLFRSQGQNAGSAALNPISSNDVATSQLLFSTLPVFTGNLQLDLARDPDDPLQYCVSLFNPNGNPKMPAFENIPIASTSILGHTPATYHVLLVISAGPDGVLGLFEPDDTANWGHLGAVKDPTALNDDIVSLSIRAGGK